jgi:hypothetical protein
MQKWEYCLVQVTQYRDGNEPDNQIRELLSVTMPGANRASASHPLGSMGLLNELGAQGWELIDVEPGGYYMKRKTK